MPLNLASLSELTPHPESDDSDLSLAPSEFSILLEKACNRIDAYTPTSDEDDTEEILSILMHNLPEGGSINLMSDIVQYQDDEKLRQLRNHLVDAILKPCKALGGTTVPVTGSPSLESASNVDSMLHEIDPSSRGAQSTLKKHCLKRDGFRCVLTGWLDRTSVMGGKITPKPGEFVIKTECAHIIPFSLADFKPNKQLETQNKATIWEALYKYFPDIKGLVSSDNINTLENAMTLMDSLHSAFGSFDLALEQTDQPNQYTVEWMNHRGPFPEQGAIVTFTSTNASVPPSPTLLKTHYQIAKILSMMHRHKIKTPNLRYPTATYVQLSGTCYGGQGNRRGILMGRFSTMVLVTV